jgi:hypothetical protein
VLASISEDRKHLVQAVGARERVTIVAKLDDVVGSCVQAGERREDVRRIDRLGGGDVGILRVAIPAAKRAPIADRDKNAAFARHKLIGQARRSRPWRRFDSCCHAVRTDHLLAGLY